MKKLILTHKLKFIGAIVGAIAGYLYYYYIGCASGACPITSNPYISVMYGMLLGILFFDLFKKKGQKTTEKSQNSKQINKQ